MTTYKLEYAKYGVGKLHLHKCIKLAMDSNIDIFDFLRGSENYKKYFKSDSQKLKKMIYENRSVSTIVKNVALRLKKSIF